MQQRACVLLALALLASQWAPAVASQAAAQEARLFLRRHASQPPHADDLAELKGENPEAYALVKALLMKRSLGLLNSRHPTASFAAPPAEQLQQAEQGPEVFQKFASPGELAAHVPQSAPVSAQVAIPYADVQSASTNKDWMNWKPQDSAANDEQMVQNVLGAVAQLKGKKAGLLSKKRNSEESSLAADEESLGAEPEAAVAPQKPAAPPAAPQENSYLKSIDFGLTSQETPQKPAAHAVKENSYLKGIDLSGDLPKVISSSASSSSSKKTSQVQGSSANYLSSFSWDDSKSQDEDEHPQPKVQQQPKADGKSNNLLAWLGVVNKAPEPKSSPAAPAKPSNPYLMDLS